MFVDASALVAIILEESGFEDLAECLQRPREKRITPFVVMEAGLALMRELESGAEDASLLIQRTLDHFEIKTTELTTPMILAALQAYERYGKGRKHPAQLNMGDCLSYAAARTLGLPLLNRGEDFARTDIPSALA